MKHLLIAFTLFSGTLLAQAGPVPPSGTAAAKGPSYSQRYCAGFLTRDSIPRTSYLLGSKESPHEDRFPQNSQLFIGGPALVEGQRYSILRQVSDPNREDSSPDVRKRLAKTGDLYQEIGWLTVHSLQKDSSVASFDFACDAAVPGDIVVPYQEKPSLAFRSDNTAIKSFQDKSDAPKGHILGAKDFIGLLGDNQIVYTDLGTEKGAKPGDYLLVLRGYAPEDLNRMDRASERLPRGSEDTVVGSRKSKPSEDALLPQHALGEVFILSATQGSSTAIITRAFAEIGLGDVVQLEK